MAQSLQIVLTALPDLFIGALITIGLTLSVAVLSMILGSLIGIMRLSLSRPLSIAARAYIEFFRGTPLIVQIFWIYFGFPILARGVGLPLKFTPLTAAILALTLNTAAYIAEIVRGSIQSIEIGQREAAKALGLNVIKTMALVIFPQALRRMLPPLGNEFTGLIKNTSLVAIIGFEELFRRGQLIVAQNYRAFEMYTAVALIYLLLTLLSSQAFNWLEYRMNPMQSLSQSRGKKPIARPEST